MSYNKQQTHYHTSKCIYLSTSIHISILVYNVFISEVGNQFLTKPGITSQSQQKERAVRDTGSRGTGNTHRAGTFSWRTQPNTNTYSKTTVSALID